MASIGTWSSNETAEIVQIINQKAIETSRLPDNGAKNLIGCRTHVKNNSYKIF